MDRPPVSTESADRKIVHTIWPCVHHDAATDCATAQEAFFRAKGALKPAPRRIDAPNPS